MKNENVDQQNLTVSTPPRPRDSLMPHANGVTMVVMRAYGPAGDSLIGIGDETFDGYPAITLKLRADGREGLVHLSPVHGDRRKTGFTDIKPGTKCELFCPVSGKRLDFVGPVDDGSGAEYYAIYLTERCTPDAMVAISDVWAHYHSRIIDDSELISYWARTHDEA